MNSFHCLIFLHDKETYINIISNEIISRESKLSLEKILSSPAEEGGREISLAIISANCFPSDEVMTLEVYIQYFRRHMLAHVGLDYLRKDCFWEAFSVFCFVCLLSSAFYRPQTLQSK